MMNKGFLALYFASFIAFLNSAINGYDNSLLGGIITMPAFLNTIGDIRQETASETLALVNGLLTLGAVAGTFCVGPLMNAFGRVRGMQFGSLIIIVSAFIEVLPQSLTWFEIGRFLLGFGVAFVVTAAPTYVVEVAHPVFRGRAGAIYNTGWNVGAVPCALILYGCGKIEGNLSWQIPLLLQAGFSAIVLLGGFFIPESPRWLMSKGRNDEARAFFTKYHADGDASDPFIDEQMREFANAMALESTGNATTYLDLFRTPALRYQVGLLVSIAIFTQYAGNGVSGGTYFTQILKYMNLGQTGDSQRLFNLVSACIGSIPGFVGGGFADKLNRRTVLIRGSILLTILFTLFTICCNLLDQGAVWGYLGFVLVNLFNIVYSFCYTPLQSLYPVEILDYKARATGMAFEQFIINAILFAQNFIIGAGIKSFGSNYFYFYGASCGSHS
ncbi:hypothetical protein HDU91_004130 [Kappamyces sp. JEL0680]|nr:hypothetical protein HDU91_004130 [Kappamyces sp. JEL0680]